MLAVVGVPVTAPVVAFRTKPAGNDPVVENEYGGVPPVAASNELYATPTWAGPTGQVTFKVGTGRIAAATTMLQGRVAAPEAESTELAVKLVVPAVIGVPKIAPVDGFKIRPAGKAVVENP